VGLARVGGAEDGSELCAQHCHAGGAVRAGRGRRAMAGRWWGRAEREGGQPPGRSGPDGRAQAALARAGPDERVRMIASPTRCSPDIVALRGRARKGWIHCSFVAPFGHPVQPGIRFNAMTGRFVAARCQAEQPAIDHLLTMIQVAGATTYAKNPGNGRRRMLGPGPDGSRWQGASAPQGRVVLHQMAEVSTRRAPASGGHAIAWAVGRVSQRGDRGGDAR
jgi:hypothetical protein